MPNFKLTFITHGIDVDGELAEDTGLFSRVIVAELRNTEKHLELARDIGQQMVGEEIDDKEFTQELVSVEPTDEAPTADYWDNARSWAWIPDWLGIRDKNEMEFVRGEFNQIVGLVIKAQKSQIRFLGRK